MTVKKLTAIENGRLVPTNLSMDADLIELSKVAGNQLEVKEDGLFYKHTERSLADGLAYKDTNILGISDFGIDPVKLKKLASTEATVQNPAETLQSLEEHLANLYGYVKKLRTDLTADTNKLAQDYYDKTYINSLDTRKVETSTLANYSTTTQTNTSIDNKITAYDTNVASAKYKLKSDPLPTATLYKSSGIYTTSPKIFVGTATANDDGDWTINYASAGFTEAPTVVVTGISSGTVAADRRFATLSSTAPTTTSCSGKLVSATSAGLLAAMSMVNASGTLNIMAIGK